MSKDLASFNHNIDSIKIDDPIQIILVFGIEEIVKIVVMLFLSFYHLSTEEMEVEILRMDYSNAVAANNIPIKVL